MAQSDIDDGKRAARAYYTSQAFTCFTRYPRAEDVIRLFLPGVTESMTQMQTPLPRPRQDWIKGFREEQAVIMSEQGLIDE